MNRGGMGMLLPQQNPQTAKSQSQSDRPAPPISATPPDADLTRHAAAGLEAAGAVPPCIELRQAMRKRSEAAGRRLAAQIAATASVPAAHAWAAGRSWQLVRGCYEASPAIRYRFAGLVVRAAFLAVHLSVPLEARLRGLTQGGAVVGLYTSRFAWVSRLSKQLGLWIRWDFKLETKDKS